MLGRLCALGCTTVFIAVLGGCVGVVPIPKGDFQLTVTTAGAGSGSVTSSPPGINCPATACTFDFPLTPQLTLTPSPTNPSLFPGCSATPSTAPHNPSPVTASRTPATAP